MTTLLFSRGAIQSLSPNRRRLVQLVSDWLDLSTGTSYVDLGGTVWLVFDDNRFTLRHVAAIGALAADINSVPVSYDPATRTRRQIAEDAHQFIRSRWVDPNSLDLSGADNPWQVVLDAQGAPAVVRADWSVPLEWTPTN